METFALLLEMLLPAVVVGVIAYLIISNYLAHEKSKHALEIERGKQDIILPARMQAFERIALYLERITPESLVRRALKTNISARHFQSELIGIVRNEYEHNMSQQVYISAATWTMVKTATEETIRLINISGSKLSITSTAGELAETILQITAQVGKFPTQTALDQVKKEFAQYILKSIN